MADATPLFSDLITNLNAVPVVKPAANVNGSAVREVVGYLAITSAQATAAAAGDTWSIVRLPSRARLSYVKLFASGVDSSTGFTFDLGILPSAGGSGTDGTDNLFLDASTALQSSGSVKGTDELAAALTPDKLESPLWSLAGAASDPGGTYDLGITVEHAVTTGAAGKVALVVGFVLNE